MKNNDKTIKEYIHIVAEHDEIANAIVNSFSEEFCFIRSRSAADAISSMTFQIPSIIIAENGAADMNAFQLLKIIRTGIKTKLIPFIIISENSNSDERITAIQSGADAFLVTPFMPEELSALVKSKLNKFKEFYLLSITDELTRLFNRREFIKKFNDITSAKETKVVSLAILDIDHFKKVNDIYGHQVGDIVLMKLADMLKDHTSTSFFPARFGGEEFVILFQDLPADAALIVMNNLLKEFSEIRFDTAKRHFFVTFSAGISEYPSMALNISELLSRADQALYSAKNEGRNRVYLFSPIMARNDKFWEHLNLKKSVFINSSCFDAVTDLPYLPHVLELIINLDFEVNSIGVMVLKPVFLVSEQDDVGYSNHSYDVENIQRILKRSCEMIFPSDTYIALSDIYETEFVVLFPSVVDFTFNVEKFNRIAGEIASQISSQIEFYGVDLLFSSDVLSLDAYNPKKLISSIAALRKNLAGVSDLRDRFNGFTSGFSSIFSSGLSFTDSCEIKVIRHISTLEPAFYKPAFIKPFDGTNIFKKFFEKLSLKDIERFLIEMAESDRKIFEKPLLLPWLSSNGDSDYIQMLNRVLPDARIILMINEYDLDMKNNLFADAASNLPENITVGMQNTYIGSDILSHLSRIDFDLIVLSDNIVRNMQMFKDRIQIINGLKVFADQIGIPLAAGNISTDEEFHIVKDIMISYVAGDFVDRLS